MSLTIGTTTPPAPVERDNPAPSNSKPTSTPPAPVDTARISNTALQAARAAAQEATETTAQTTREARAGDRQAQRRLAQTHPDTR